MKPISIIRTGASLAVLLGASALPASAAGDPVTDVRLAGVEGDELSLDLHDIMALRFEVEPATASNKGVSIRMENASAEGLANGYSVGGAERFTELVTYRPGTFDLVLTAASNPEVTRTYHVTINPLEPDGSSGDHTQGTFWLNEEWFTHKNGSVSYLANPLPEDDSEIVYHAYSRENDDASFGATSQYAMIFAGKLFVMSKQEHDRGDIRGNGGGRLVIADASTLQRLASFDELGGDGRACVGVSENKAYIGTHAGIRVLTWEGDKFTLQDRGIRGIGNDTEGTGSDIGSNQQLYNRQIGDMVRAGRYVYALQQGVGVHVIDGETDTLVCTIPDAGVQGIAQTADGDVWYASTQDASAGHTLLWHIPFGMTEAEASTEVPGTIGCSWGSWRSTNFFASRTDDVLFWNGGASGITSSGTSIYRWNIHEPAEELQPLYEFPRTEGTYPGVYQQIYASMRYDDRTDCILFATTTAPSGNYRYNWLNFLNATSGELESSVRLKDYYWFPALPVFPDAYAPEFDEIAPIIIDAEPFELSLEGLAHDADNIERNITIKRVASSGARSGSLDDIADVEEKEGTLVLTPKQAGTAELALCAESNGRVAYAYLPVTVSGSTNVEAPALCAASVSIEGRKVRLRGLDGETFVVADMAGTTVSAFEAVGDECTVTLMLDKGLYILAGRDGSRSIKFFIGD